MNNMEYGNLKVVNFYFDIQWINWMNIKYFFHFCLFFCSSQLAFLQGEIIYFSINFNFMKKF